MASILSVRKGDLINDRLGSRSGKIVVTDIKFNACSSKGVHINQNSCYDNTHEVTILSSRAVEEEVEDDWNADLDVDGGLKV